jgi:hypothetical protein
MHDVVYAFTIKGDSVLSYVSPYEVKTQSTILAEYDSPTCYAFSWATVVA